MHYLHTPAFDALDICITPPDKIQVRTSVGRVFGFADNRQFWVWIISESQNFLFSAFKKKFIIQEPTVLFLPNPKRTSGFHGRTCKEGGGHDEGGPLEAIYF
jgi:hypothetical protein